MREPKDCTEKAHIREAIDELDAQLVDLFAKRDSYVRRMAEIKTHPSQARIEERVKAVLDKVLERLEERELAPDLYMQFWEDLIEVNIAWEEEAIAARLAGDKE
ncbi:chorismate mutase [Cohaesibacter gelatinilyticus]|uniref:chorismate mutase n=1 Tax=Cohaesibacter gelatinilyticus TaxID=372072 RepID=A0A285NFG5_9HYPH|nr:chorismate mutase [Cohaesibacter gelatinilyticus]SNZ08199.1 isochorismate pyruvate lyase [Cohaesibacter gelatinilyticus]HAT85892.1 chorismate mutase [Hyphomicrobiales bacterium]